MTDNLELWHSVERTDPKHTKKITGKQYGGDSPKPHWIIMRATETFGPCGIGWGFTVEERVENGALVAPGHHERLHLAKVKVWYKWKGERGEVEHIGGTPMSGVRSNGKTFTDEDCAKKSVTDALIKALSMIGFAADIFMGRYDDSKYLSEVNGEFREAEREKEPNTTDILQSVEKSLSAAALLGTESLVSAWKALPANTREAFGGACPSRFKDIAKANDDRKAA